MDPKNLLQISNSAPKPPISILVSKARSATGSRPPAKRTRSIDGFMAVRPQPRTVMTPKRPVAATQRPTARPQTPIRPSQPARLARPYAAPIQQPAQPEPLPDARPSFFKRLLIGIGKFLLGIGIFIFAFLAQSPAIGQLAIGVYAIAALGWRISSRITFTMAVMALGLVILASIRSDVTLANTFALYVFLLLIVGTLTLWREVRSEI
jgi:hypothetical protein